MNRNKSATLTTRTHRGRPRFSIPKVIRDEIGICGSTPSGPGDAVKLVVDSVTGHYKGSALLRSGSEIYGSEIVNSGIRKKPTDKRKDCKVAHYQPVAVVAPAAIPSAFLHVAPLLGTSALPATV